jgi:hypothetical protein
VVNPVLAHRRKGISQIIAAMFMISLAVAGALIVYVYSTGLLGTLQGAKPQQSFADQLALEYYDWTNTTNLKMQVRNVGSSNMVIKEIFIYGSNITKITWGMPPNTCPNGNMPVQAACLIQLTPPTGLTNGTAYPVVFVTSTGTTIRFSAIYGQTG